MLDTILEHIDKLEKIFSTLKINLILGVIVNIIILFAVFKLIDVFTGKLKNKFSDNENALIINNVIPALGKVFKFIIAFIIIASFLQSQGYSLTSLIAGFGITGIAVGFAAQQTIASMFGTFALVTDKVYRIGDYIKVNNIEGTVEAISIRSTKIRSLENFLVTVPNDTIANSIVLNITKAKKRRIDITFGVTYNTSDEKLEKAMEIIKETITERSDVHKNPAVFVDTLADSSINLRLVTYTKSKFYDDYAQIKSNIYLNIVKKFRKEGIEFAFPSQTVYMGKDEN